MSQTHRPYQEALAQKDLRETAAERLQRAGGVHRQQIPTGSLIELTGVLQSA